ncbi:MULTISPECIES: hypothetical protein [unclassified Mesorhizobium]|uniref:hypothetical protein n=1 Tax=unclassified Mesorhizobium TaxID=325217 RepID=UPI000FD84E6A|nr:MULTISPECIES: hypothetical protein [unclassified Mesorhizobium]TGQ16364.1 hypothetical protein EN862_002375 [Mesorhizobium sp. M2E.F.Ca.ET.219.01.1.1]TGT77539.1 hypothetical protein EN809_008185 [Mesorhizobium sp. M2E.F.Ca.ET.166.01.1.1]TGW03648.1 hypothetical protein EN797_008185 [Mesorhizobium sp. M2E.F.Ca.ET.154.01.1.1]
MRRSTQLVMVYAELRRALGHEVGASVVLEIAQRLTNLANYRKVIDLRGAAEVIAPGCVPLDRAFEDGGWALLHEVYASGLLGDDDSGDYSCPPGRRAAQMMENWA